jgi:hypothetical protein
MNKNLIVNIDTNNPLSNEGGFNVISLNRWRYSKTNDINLLDYGLTSFDVGATDKMHTSKEIKFEDDKLTLKRIGYNEIINPTKNDIGPYSATTRYDGYEIEEVGSTRKYFNLNGGYLSGFFKLDGYNYEVIPSRYKEGFTIENLLYVEDYSTGIFFLMGVRSEDKYNPEFSGETGVYTSENENLDSLVESWEYNKAFKSYELELKKDTQIQPENIDNIDNNLICFGIDENKKLFYKRILDGGLKTNTSPHEITETGFTLISIVYEPDYQIEDKDLLCHEIRNGNLYFYVNGRLVWDVKDVPEPIFNSIENKPTKQIGVPYTISWGGGSFGLKHSHHYDTLTRFLYENENTPYIQNGFKIKDASLNDLGGFLLSSDNQTFTEKDEDNQNIPLSTIKLEYTGNTSNNINSLMLLFDNPIKVLSNRTYLGQVNLYDENFLKYGDNELKLVVLNNTQNSIIDQNSTITSSGDGWVKIDVEFNIPNNIGEDDIYLGILIQSEEFFNLNGNLYFSKFTYSGSDVLVKDNKKEELFIERNFDGSFIGGVQKLRIYDKPLNMGEIQKNVVNDNVTGRIGRGGRLIYM